MNKVLSHKELAFDTIDKTDAAAGGADDWAFGVAGIPYVYTIELRDTGRYGFILPKEYIIPTGEEFYDGLRHYALDLIPDLKIKA